MQLLQVDQIAKSFGQRDVLREVSLGVSRGERIALVGANGSGKTTLLRIIAGELAPDHGKLTWLRLGLQLGYLPQVVPAGSGLTVGEAMAAAAAAGCRPGEEERSDEGRVAEALGRFGLPPGSMDTPLAQLSGGERTRCGLAGMWLQDADLMLLDEPTNHLDIAGLRWLEQWIGGYRGTVLVVSHDRYFLDQVATRVVALEDGRAHSYPGNYTAYREAHAAEIESRMQQYRDEERRVRQLRAAITRQANWAEQSHARAAEKGDSRAAWVFYRNKAEKIAQRGKALGRRLEQLEARRTAKPRLAPAFSLSLQSATKTGKIVAVVENLAKAYAVPVFSGVSFSVGRGEKVGLLGANGSGKTTLLRILAGDLAADSGFVHVLPSANAAYLDQHACVLNPERTPVDEVQGLVPNPSSARTLLGSFLFDEQRALTRVGDLSPGERSRLALLLLLLSPANLLLLDEPTNYLDLPSREQVETALATYEGAVLLVSHDRYLLQRICTRVVALGAGGATVYHGGYADWEAHATEADRGKSPAHLLKAPGEPISPGGAAASGDRTRAADRERRMLLENRLAILSGQLAKLTSADNAYPAAVQEFMAVARELRNMDEQSEKRRP